MADYIHGSTDDHEVARLEKQARYVAPFSLKGFVIAPGARVLDLGTGVGAMAQQLLDRYPSIRLTGVDLRPTQLARARENHPGADYIQADATKLPFPDGTFDNVHASWLLEHVPVPEKVIAEIHRVMKPGGTCRVIEVDNTTLRIEPLDAEAMELLDAGNRAQQAAGGDPFIGPKLEGLFRRAGFAKVHVETPTIGGGAEAPEERRKLCEEFAEIFLSLDEALGPDSVPRLQAAANRLLALNQSPNGHVTYVPTILTATR